MARAPRHGDQVNDGVGGAAHGHGAGNAVLEMRTREHAGGREVFPHHLHDAAAALGAHADVVGVGGRNGRSARQRQAHGLGNAHHGGRRAHGHAGAVAAGNAGFHLAPGLLIQPAGAAFVPELEGVRARAQHLPLPVAAQHGAGRQVDEGKAHGDRPHGQPRRGLVAAAHEHGAIHRVAAQQLLRLHGQEVAIDHGRGLDHAFRQRDGWQLQRKAARLQHAALDVFHALPEVGMALVGIAPGVDDGDHGLAHPVLVAIAHLQHARAVAEGAEIIGSKPACAAQGFGGTCHGCGAPQ